MSREFHIATELIMACWYCVERVTEQRLGRLQRAVDGYSRALASAVEGANPLLVPLHTAARAMLDSNWKDAAERRADLSRALAAFSVVAKPAAKPAALAKLPVRSVRQPPKAVRDPSDGSVNMARELSS